MKRYIQICMIVSLLNTSSVMASLGSIGKMILKSMETQAFQVTTNQKPALDVVKRISGLQKAARDIGESLPSSKREKVAIDLERIVIRELNRHGFNQATALACPACLPGTLADDIGGRVIDILKDYNELLAKALLEPNQVRLLDENGSVVNSISDREKAFDSVLRRYYVVFKQTDTTSWVKYLASVKSGISRSGIEAVVDAQNKLLSITVSSGSLKGKLINIDLSTLYEKVKIYITGGGIGALGYVVVADEQDSGFSSSSSLRMAKRHEALRNLNRYEKDKLLRAADARYIELLYEDEKTNK